jgi:hypothetical protein
MLSANTPKSSISAVGLIRTSLWRATAPIALVLGPASLSTFALGAITLSSQADASDLVIFLVAVVVFLVFLLVVGTFILGGTNYSTKLRDAGVEVYEWSLHPDWVYRRDVTRGQTESLKLPGKTGSDSVVWVGFMLFQFDRAQSRATLGDPRCPLHQRIPEDYSRRLGLKL